MSHYLDSNGLSYVWNKIANLNDWMPANAGAHNSIYRGKDITDKFEDGSLYSSIASGTFHDVFVGDYFVAPTKGISGTIENSEVVVSTTPATDRIYRIMGLDTKLYRGKTMLGAHHATIMCDLSFGTAPMNGTSTTTSSYVRSAMYTTVIPTIVGNLVEIFDDHMIFHDEILGNQINSDGKTSFWQWNSCSAVLLNEVEVYGSQVWGATGNNLGYEVGIGYGQLPAFRLAPELISTSREPWWLRSVYDSSSFCCVGSHGTASTEYADQLYGVRPAFLIG